MRWAGLLIIVAAVLGCLSGCGQPGLGMTYDVLLDKSLTADEVEVAVAAGHAHIVAEGVELKYIIASCASYQTLPAHTICIHADSDSPLDSEGFPVYGHTSFDASLALDRADFVFHPVSMSNNELPYRDVLYNVMAHEFGHALAHRGDHLPVGNLMAPRMSLLAQLETITPADVAYFWSNR